MSVSLCGSIGANTGGIQCDVSRGILKRLYISGGAISSSEYADATSLEAALIAASLLPKTDKDKIFPLPEVQDIADKSDANKEGSLNQGFKTVLLEGKPAYELKFFGGATLVKALRKFNNQTVRVLELDANGRLWGTFSGTDVVGFQAKLFFGGLKSATGQNVEEGVITMSLSFLDTSEYYDNAVYLDVSGVNMTNVEGLIDATLSEAAAHTANAYKIAVKVPTSQAGTSINLYDEFADELADASLWEAFTGATYSTSLTITSVAKDATLKAWTVTFDSTAFTALGSGKNIKLNLKAPALLDAGDVTGVEGVAIVVSTT